MSVLIVGANGLCPSCGTTLFNCRKLDLQFIAGGESPEALVVCTACGYVFLQTMLGWVPLRIN